MQVIQSKPLSIKRAADTVQQFAASGGEWWIAPASLVEGKEAYQRPRTTDLVVTGPDGRELGRWPLMPITYGSLVSRHAKNPAGEFALPHARGYRYDDFEQIAELKWRAKDLIEAMASSLNAIKERIYFVDDTAGIDLAAAEVWWSQAEEVIEKSCFSRLRVLFTLVGPPGFWQHSSQLVEVLPQAQEGYRRLRDFLTTMPPPTPDNQSGIKSTPGDGSRYQMRNFASLNAGSGGSVFTSKFQENRINEWRDTPPFDREWPAEDEPAQPTTLQQKLLEIQRLVGEVLRELD